MTIIGHHTNPADARRRHVLAAQAIFAGAATIATLALFSAAPQADASPIVAQHSAATASAGVTSNVIAVDDNGGVNDQGQTSGDIFTQNAQDQSTASGAGTS